VARKPTKQRRQRRQRNTLDVYDRGGRWWAKVPKRGRVSLGLAVADASRDEAYRVAARRYASGALDARAADAGREGRLVELSRLYVAEQRHRWAPRQAGNVAGRLAAFVDALASAGITRIEHVTADALARYVAAEQARAAQPPPEPKPAPERKGRRKGPKLPSRRVPDGPRKATNVTDATINRTIQIARAMARWAAHRTPPLCDDGALARWKNLREVARNADPVIPSPAEWATVVREVESEPPLRTVPRTRAREVANARGLALLVALGVQTGLRIDELRHLRDEDIGADVVRVRAYGDWKPKDREERDVPVPPSVAALAREMLAWRKVAVGVSGKPVKLSDNYVLDAVKRAWPRCNIPGAPPGMHDCRRTFATEMSRRPGVSLRDVQRLLGHADLATTQRYLGRYRSDAARPAVDMGLADVLKRGPLADVLPMKRSG